MTLGQRIAQKRKELGLSQEALGDQLGVSRQAIYKWESNSGLPEIEKLISLSRIFSVSVGWLLGVEETPQQEQAGPSELTETQLEMVRQIVAQYLAAQPEPVPKKRRLIVKIAVVCGALCLVMVLWNLFDQLERANNNYNNLQNSIGNLQGNVNSQISSITSRVESILKYQNQLTAEYHTAHVSTDPAANTATFSLRAVPKTFVEGMTALFTAQIGEETFEIPVEPGKDHAFTGQITCPLTDEETVLSVVFLSGDKRETQLLDSYGGLYSASFPSAMIDSWPLHWDVTEKNVLPATQDANHEPLKAEVSTGEDGSPAFDPETMDLQVGLFRDQKLVLWYEKGPYEYILNGIPTTEERWFRPRAVTLEPGHSYTQAILLTDQYGRQYVYSEIPISYNERHGEWGTPDQSYEQNGDPSRWSF